MTALTIHIIAGGLGIVSGFLALYAVKGATLHRKSGMVFVCAMLTTSIVGALLAGVQGKAPAVNIPAAVLTAYLIITALATVRPAVAASRRLQLGAMLVAFAVGLTNLRFGFEALANGGRREGIPAFPFIMFGVVGLLAGVGDLRLMRSGGALRGTLRLARHLWRMCFALLIAVMSFFLGQARVIPKPIRIPALLALPVLAVLVLMLYWMWRVRFRRSFRGIVVVRAREAV
jgi:uncharacterized membrane protein